MCCSSRAGKLIPEIEYKYFAPDDREKIRRPLSPVRLRRQMGEETPEKILSVKDKNEQRARGSPFVSHMPRKTKEHYLFTIGSVREPQDEDLKMEMALKSKLSKIASPIKPSQNSRNLHLPKKQITTDSFKNGFHGACHGHGPSPSKESNHVLIINSAPDPDDSQPELDLWPHVSPYPPSAHTLAANACATPGSSISDLSDRDTTTPLYTDRDPCDSLPTMSRGGSGVFGGIEDDLISGGSVNEDEYIL